MRPGEDLWSVYEAVAVMPSGKVVSQGQTNGLPVYRFTWQTLGSTHLIFEWCNTSVGAKPYALGSDEYVNPELSMAWHGRCLPEAP
jgi:sulfur-oxidizing protein SoxA